MKVTALIVTVLVSTIACKASAQSIEDAQQFWSGCQTAAKSGKHRPFLDCFGPDAQAHLFFMVSLWVNAADSSVTLPAHKKAVAQFNQKISEFPTKPAPSQQVSSVDELIAMLRTTNGDEVIREKLLLSMDLLGELADHESAKSYRGFLRGMAESDFQNWRRKDGRVTASSGGDVLTFVWIDGLWRILFMG
ncbi:MAG: hypothetical protein AB8B96_13400 [Lysobacterales bacterium]